MIRYPSPLVETRKDHALVSQEPQSQCTNSALPTATSQLGYSASEAWTHQRIHREIRTPFTCPSRNLSSGYSSSKAWTHQRIHCRYSIRTDQYLARLDILLVKHGLTNAFTETSEHPSHAPSRNLSSGYSSSKAWTHQRIHCRYSIRTDQYLARLDILLVKHGLTNAFTETSEHPSHAHLEICHQDILAAKHGLTNAFTVDIPSEPISTWRVWIFCWSSMDSPTHSQRNPNTLHMPISISLIRIF